MNKKLSSKEAYEKYGSVDKRFLRQYTSLKINKAINVKHIAAVINILFDEIIKDLKAGKTIPIKNFGKFVLEKTSPRDFHNVGTMRMERSKGKLILRFMLSSKLRKVLLDNIDIEKTFKL